MKDGMPTFYCADCHLPFTEQHRAAKCGELDRRIRATRQRISSFRRKKGTE